MSNDTNDIKWNTDYETGIDEIDDQHHILVNTLNEANELLSKEYSMENLQNITKDLLSYALYHFETEEEMMHKYDYEGEAKNDFDNHMKQHRDFSSKVVELRDSLKSGNMVGKDELIGFLLNWLLNHIEKTDKKFGKFLQTKM